MYVDEIQRIVYGEMAKPMHLQASVSSESGIELMALYLYELVMDLFIK